MSRVRRRVLLAVSLLAVVVTVLAGVGAALVGLALVVDDGPAPSDAIVVLFGGTPSREIEAASLYHRGYAPRIVIARGRDLLLPAARQLSGLPGGQDVAAGVLEHLRVPQSAIVRVSEEADNTADELTLDFELARSRGWRRLLLVTSPAHTRRVRMIWNAHFERALPARVYPTPWERYPAAGWWRSRRSLEQTLHELFGIANFMVGSPLPTDRPE
jgi:uncharacterized SAM-binding protein YcdF (DUF218 family)